MAFNSIDNMQGADNLVFRSDWKSRGGSEAESANFASRAQLQITLVRLNIFKDQPLTGLEHQFADTAGGLLPRHQLRHF